MQWQVSSVSLFPSLSFSRRTVFWLVLTARSITDFFPNYPGGSQSYCCAGFVPSPYTSTDNLNLIGQDQVQGLQERNIQKRQNSFVNSLCKNASPKQGIDLIVGR